MANVAKYIFLDVGTIIGFIISLYFVGVTTMKLSKTDMRDPASRAMLNISMVAIFLFLFHQFTSIIDYSYSVATGKVNQYLTIFGALYFLGRIVIYGLFIHRLNYIVQGSFTSYPPRVIQAMYSLVGVIIFSLVILLIGFVAQILPIVLIAGFTFVLVDIALCITLPLLFVGKLYQLVEFKESIEKNENKMHHEQHTSGENPDSSRVNTSIELNKTSPSDKLETSIPSIEQIGATSEKAPVNQDKNQFKFDTILFTASKISLLSSITLLSMLIVLPIGIASQRFPNTTWIASIPELMVKADSALNVICVCLCFKINDDWYMKLCSAGHRSCQERQCYGFWKCCCIWCIKFLLD